MRHSGVRRNPVSGWTPAFAGVTDAFAGVTNTVRSAGLQPGVGCRLELPLCCAREDRARALRAGVPIASFRRTPESVSGWTPAFAGVMDAFAGLTDAVAGVTNASAG